MCRSNRCLVSAVQEAALQIRVLVGMVDLVAMDLVELVAVVERLVETVGVVESVL